MLVPNDCSGNGPEQDVRCVPKRPARPFPPRLGPMRAAARMVSLNQCATMRDVLTPARPLPEPTRTSRRRTRLHRGARRFWHDVNSDGRRYHQVLLFALTVASFELAHV